MPDEVSLADEYSLADLLVLEGRLLEYVREIAQAIEERIHAVMGGEIGASAADAAG
jgi:hypothetical protein